MFGDAWYDWYNMDFYAIFTLGEESRGAVFKRFFMFWAFLKDIYLNAYNNAC